jgi:hypothetical protein
MLTLALTAVAAVLVLPAMLGITHSASVIQAQATDDVTVASTLLPIDSQISSAAVVYSPSPASGTNNSTQDTGTQARKCPPAAQPGRRDVPVRPVGGGVTR